MSGQLPPYLCVAAGLFTVGLFGVLTRRNAIAVLMGIELMLNAANLNLIAFQHFLGPNASVLKDGALPAGYIGSMMGGHVFSVIVITVAAAEAAVGLAIIIAIYRTARTVNVDEINWMKW